MGAFAEVIGDLVRFHMNMVQTWGSETSGCCSSLSLVGRETEALLSCSREGEESLDQWVLARVVFQDSDEQVSDPRVVQVPTPVLDGCAPAEVWRSGLPVSAGHEGSIGFAGNGDLLFAHVRAGDPTGDNFAEFIRQACRRILSFARARGYCHVLRMWNVVPRLNEGEGDDERYKQFCIGRARAFDELLTPGSRPPAASCVGFDGKGVLIYLLASRQPGVPIENPRQVRADWYPRVYGPCPPSFCRAMLHQVGSQMYLHVSGTASIVGHETVHPRDFDSQIEETVRNLGAVLGCAAEKTASEALSLERPSLLRVYLRDGAHLDRLCSNLDRLLGPDVPKIILRADLCRRSLLVEIEGFWCIGERVGRRSGTMRNLPSSRTCG